MSDTSQSISVVRGVGRVPGARPPAVSMHRAAARAARRRAWSDRVATVIVTAGGIAIIASILAILLFIVIEVVPLAYPAEVREERELAMPGPAVGAMATDEHRTHVATLGEDGIVRVARWSDSALVVEQAVLPSDGSSAAPLAQVGAVPGASMLTAATADGRVALVRVNFEMQYVGDQRVIRPSVAPAELVEIDPEGRSLGLYAARAGQPGETSVVAQLADGSLVLVENRREENAFSGEVAVSSERATAAGPGALAALVLDPPGRNLYGANEQGQILWWPLAGGWPAAGPQVGAQRGAPVTALSLLLGGRSLAVGRADGSLEIWFVVPGADGAGLVRVRDFPAHDAPIRAIVPSSRDKSFLALDREGGLGLYHSTSERVLWTGRAPVEHASALAYARKGNGAYVAGAGAIARMEIDNRHPEVSWRALFGRVWYEGYPRPEYVWQSSSGTDDFEPKLSLTPLLVGTLKGTIYSLLIAIPLAVFGAMYTSQFMHPNLKRLVKPTVEIMAALPSVVLGFLAGLWLAPRLERAMPAVFLMVIVLPLLTLAAGALWQLLPRRARGRAPAGSEAIYFVFVLGAGIWLCLQLGVGVETLLFGGSFPDWLLTTTGLGYDQRNAVVVGLAMGFAVIPIIFAISEDAFSNVPRVLVSGSLALGANRWQTVTRIVLPTASPGIFSAIMVGFGRAVGETMIVLMATGNTPIIDFNPFNGFRTLSANIAVEIPEAPQFGTLYRVLFFAALLLFVVTFVVNTAAELVRQRLRRRYSQL